MTTTHYIVTAENLDEARADCAACDQAAELEPGCETWGIFYRGQRGQMTVWPDSLRGSVSYGADSAWGEWDAVSRTLHIDGDVIDVCGDVIDVYGDVVA